MITPAGPGRDSSLKKGLEMTARHLRVLLAEKRLTEAGIILRSICAEAGWALEVAYVAMKGELGEALKTHHPDVALLDLSLLQPDAVSEVRVLHVANRHVPFILFAEPADRDCAVECLSMGARDFLLEGYMDERTVARVLQSAVGVGEEKAPQGVGDCPSAGCALSINLETLVGTQLWIGRGAAEEMLEELMKVLKRNVRTRDEIVPRRCGQIDLVLTDGNERCAGAIIRRLQAQVETHKGSQCRELGCAVTVRAGQGAVAAQPLLTQLSGCEATGEGCAEQTPLPIEERA